MSPKTAPIPSGKNLPLAYEAEFIDAVNADDGTRMINAIKDAFMKNKWLPSEWAALKEPSGGRHIFWPIAENGAVKCMSAAVETAFDPASWNGLQEIDKQSLTERLIFPLAEYHSQRENAVGNAQADDELEFLFVLFFTKDQEQAPDECKKFCQMLPQFLTAQAGLASLQVEAAFIKKALDIITSKPFAQSLLSMRI